MRDHVCYFHGIDHADFNGVDSDIFKNSFQLFLQKRGRNRVNGPHALGILRSERRNGRRSVCTECGNRFQIGLDARATSAVGSGDGKYSWVTIHMECF
ncbi:hypothetical protein D3C87_1601000 [compost metagenome]